MPTLAKRIALGRLHHNRYIKILERQTGKQWDAWRCYRCNRWRPAGEKRTPHPTPAGIVVSVCERCATEKKQP